MPVTPPPATQAAGGAEPASATSILGASKGEFALVVEHLAKRFGNRVAFDDVSFEVGHDEVFGFLGPNGAGKTTTARTLGTLIAPNSGSAIVAGIPLSPKDGPAIRSRISIMPESPGLYLRLKVMENLRCFAGLYELDDPKAVLGTVPEIKGWEQTPSGQLQPSRERSSEPTPMGFSWTRVGAILRKELQDYRRNRFVIGTMAAVPVLFIILPMIQLIAADAIGKNLSVRVELSLLYMLVIPVMVPSVVSAYSVVGEREQGTLEPVLITPIRREGFLIGKALAALLAFDLLAWRIVATMFDRERLLTGTRG